MGDVISSASSHQAVLIHLLDDFVSGKGLRVKVWGRGEDNQFPGGFEFHRSPHYMKQIMREEKKPYIFHMSWTDSSKTKKNYFKQIGEWYTKDDISGCNGLGCCLAHANISCYYRDKPSKIPCNESPFMEKKGNKPFWF